MRALVRLTTPAPADKLTPFPLFHRAPPEDGHNGVALMTGHESVKSLLVLRKLTRSIADVLRTQLMDNLATLTPLLQQQGIFGEYIQGPQKEPSPRADQAFK